eukprot:4120923-Prymnesium_polylepis.1
MTSKENRASIARLSNVIWTLNSLCLPLAYEIGTFRHVPRIVLSRSMHATGGTDVGVLDVPDLVGSLFEGFREWIEQAVCIAL